MSNCATGQCVMAVGDSSQTSCKVSRARDRNSVGSEREYDSSRTAAPVQRCKPNDDPGGCVRGRRKEDRPQDSSGDQLLPPPERHTSIADPRYLSDSPDLLPS